MDIDDEGTGRALLDAEVAEASGHATALLRAVDREVASAIVAERAPSYVTLLYALLVLRRAHEIEPLHDDVARFVARAAREVDAAWDEDALGRDLGQLLAWKCLERRAEPLKIRGYKDVRRERYRYRLTDDAVALLEWLEGRLESAIQGRAHDGRDLLTDVVGHLKELMRLVRQWHGGERADDAPRRSLHLLMLIDDRVHAITEELLTFRASMLAFASRPYDVEALQAILIWLGRYVELYLDRIRMLREEIASALVELSAPRFVRVLAEHRDQLARERAEVPAAFRGTSAVRDPREILDAQRPFFDERGRLFELCARIDDSARAVLRKMHRHLRELERRNARLSDLRARVAELVAVADADPRLSEYANALVASGHARFGGRGGPAAGRVAPPLPRKHAAPHVDRRARSAIRPKTASTEIARELRARRLADLQRWLLDEVLRGASEVRLSAAPLTGADVPRRWLDVARARHLDRGRHLLRIDMKIDAREGEVRLGDHAAGLAASDCMITRGALP